jgi:multidrug efflux pump subunit AcrA (membrane-fusion protein)
MKHTWMVWIGTAAVSAACASGPGQQSDQRTAASVVTAPAELTELASSIEAGGIVRARVTALIESRVMAPIVDVRVGAGDRVRRGQVLVTLDARDLRAAEARAQAATLSAAESISVTRSRSWRVKSRRCCFRV